MTNVHDDLPEPEQREELFITFANTLEFSRGAPHDSLPDADALLAWLRVHGLLSSRAQAAEGARLRRDSAEETRRLDRFRHLRSLLHSVAGQMVRAGRPTDESVEALNHILRHGLHYHQLVQEGEGGRRYSIAQVGDRLDQARATIAGSFAQFLADEATSRLRVCANEGCRYLFVDHSPTGRRRWCDMRTCGNQAKVARHRARARADAAPVVNLGPGSA